jgi:hypothetical protein
MEPAVSGAGHRADPMRQPETGRPHAPPHHRWHHWPRSAASWLASGARMGDEVSRTWLRAALFPSFAALASYPDRVAFGGPALPDLGGSRAGPPGVRAKASFRARGERLQRSRCDARGKGAQGARRRIQTRTPHASGRSESRRHSMTLHEDGFAIRNSGRPDLWPAARNPGAASLSPGGGLDTSLGASPPPAAVPAAAPAPTAASAPPSAPAPAVQPQPAAAAPKAPAAPAAPAKAASPPAAAATPAAPAVTA